MTFEPVSIERDNNDMQLPILSANKCVNHPTVKAVKKHLCSQCYAKWEKTVLDYEAIQQGEVLSPE